MMILADTNKGRAIINTHHVVSVTEYESTAMTDNGYRSRIVMTNGETYLISDSVDELHQWIHGMSR